MTDQMKKLFSSIILICFSLLCLQAQDFSSDILAKYRSRVNAVNSEKDKRINEAKSAFLKKQWEMSHISDKVEDPFSKDEATPLPPAPKDEEKPVVKPVIAPKGSVGFRFYGTSYKVRFVEDQKITLDGVSSKSIASAWEKMSTPAYENTVKDCMEIRKNDALCDWAYLCLVDSLSSRVFPGRANEARMLMGYILGESGCDIRFGIEDGRLRLLYGTSTLIYGKGYYTLGGRYYYALDENTGSMSISESSAPDGAPLSMDISGAQRIGGDETLSREVRADNLEFDFEISRGLALFYAQYPHVEWTYKANAAGGKPMEDIVYPALREMVKGMDQLSAANEILHFVASATSYKNDPDYWGYEKWNFAEESCLYPCGDCDDHAILFCNLIKNVLGIPSILVQLQVDEGAHLAAAICLDKAIDGDCISYEGAKWYCCEPTSRSAKVGQKCWNKYEIEKVSIVR